jgi:DNA-binding response OmpR family regulator
LNPVFFLEHLSNLFNGKYPLTTRERMLLQAFLKQEDLFLHSDEIRELLAIKDVKSMISRLRTKLRGVTSHMLGISINIIPIKGEGYYMELVVDNLWKT